MDAFHIESLIATLKECAYDAMSNREDYGSVRWDIDNVKLMNEIESTVKDYIKCSD